MSDERVRPTRVRVTGLQEAQLHALMEAEKAATAMYYEKGFDAAEVPTRAMTDIVALTKDHNVHVAEADHEPAGYAAWRDESPGVAYVEEISVHPDLHRFGIGSRLLEAIHNDARNAGLKYIVLRAWTKAGWAMGFYKTRGFVPIDESAPAKVQAWKAERSSSGRPFTRPGEIALWATVREPEPEPDDDEEQPEAGDESSGE